MTETYSIPTCVQDCRTLEANMNMNESKDIQQEPTRDGDRSSDEDT